MTETRFTWRWLLVIALVGIVMGTIIGLIAGWIVFPNIGASSVSGLSVSAQNDYIVLVANTYAYDQDLARAKQRLNLLQDNDIKERVERLAKSLGARKDASAANVADLAVALGSADSSLQVMAQSVSSDVGSDPNSAEPTKVARSDADAQATAESEATPTEQSSEPTVEPTKKKTKKPTEAAPTEAPAEPTTTPKPQAPKATAAPTATPPPAAAPVTTQFIPDFPGGWWGGINFVPASVSAGQEYWHLKWALFCDVDDQRNNCPSLPGGGMDHSIYVAVVNPDGSCADAQVKHETNTGDTTPLEQKDVPYAWHQYACNKDFEWNMYGEGNDIWIDGLPSDRLNGMCLCNVVPPPGTTGILQGHAHVRYFLVFQRTTR
jgi:hypothetical protein